MARFEHVSRVLLCSLVGALAVACFGQAAYGQPPIHWVETEEDEGESGNDQSLREAVRNAASGDYVQFRPGVSGSVLSDGEGILIDKDLTIIGGAGITVEQTSADSVFIVGSGKTADLRDLIITGGTGKKGDPLDPQPDDGFGGGVFSKGHLIANNCLFTGNTAGRGGAIYVTGAGTLGNPDQILTVNNCTFTGNSAGDGGAIYLTGSRVKSDINDSVFQQNSCQDHGGAILNESTEDPNLEDPFETAVTISNTLIGGPDPGDENGPGDKNNCMGFGGGIANGIGASLTIKNGSIIQGNEAANFHGGGIYNLGDLNIEYSDLYDNSAGVAGDGGAIYNGPTQNNETPYTRIIGWCNIFRNTSEHSGGAIYNDGMLDIGELETKAEQRMFFENRANTKNGGAIYNASTGVVTIIGRVRIEKNFADGGGEDTGSGGGVYNAGALTMDGTASEVVVLKDNSAELGGGLFCANFSFNAVDNAGFISNDANLGDGIYEQANVTIVWLGAGVFFIDDTRYTE